MKRGVILLVLALILTGCASQVPASNKSFDSLNYEVKECMDNGDELLDINVEERAIQIHQIVETNCCFDIELSYKKTNGILRVYEDFSGLECDCTCKREINAEIDGKGINEIEFYSRDDLDFPYELLLELER